MSSELRVGVLFVIGVMLIATFVFFFSNVLRRPGAFVVNFQRIVRLDLGDPVTYNGVKVGAVTAVKPVLTVDKITGIATPRVEIQYSITGSYQDSVLINAQTEFRIDQGLLGGSSLAIVSSGGVPIGSLNQAQIPHGIDPVSIDQTLAALKKILDDNRDDIRGTIHNARSAVEHIDLMAQQIHDLVQEERPQVAVSLKNVGDMTGAIKSVVQKNDVNITDAIASLKSLMRRLDDLVADSRDRIQHLLITFNQAGENVAKVSATLDATVSENRENLKKTMAGLGAVSTRLDAIGANVQLITGQIAAGRGTIGKLVMDDTLHDHALKAIDSFDQRMDELKPVTGPIAALRFYGGVSVGYDPNSGVTDSEAYLRLEPRPYKFYVGGVSYRTAPKGLISAQEDQNSLGIDFDFQFGWRFFADDKTQQYRLTLAGGLIDSQIGAWAETPVDPPWLNFFMLARGKDSHRPVDDRRYEHGNVLLRAYFEASFYDQHLAIDVGGNDLTDKPGFWLGIRGELLDNDLRNITSLASFAQ